MPISDSPQVSKLNSTIFKTWLTDLTKIQGVVNNINNINAWANGATGLLNPSVVNSLSSAINGLNLQQAQLALSTKNLTKEQMNQVLVQTGLIASENQIQAELVQSALAQSSVSAETQKAILQELGLINVRTGEVLVTKSCTKEELLNTLATKGVTGANAEAIISTLGLTGANEKATLSFGLLNKAIRDSISSRINLTKADVGMLAGVAALAFTIYKCNKAVEEAREKAQELGSSFKDASSEIEDYKSKIEELHKTINDNTSSIEDVTEARKSLLSIQDELIDKFGTEESIINNVTDAINGQTEALDKLSKAKWQETKNEFTHGGFWNDAANFFQNTDNIERMLDEYGDKTISFKWTDYADINKLTDEMVAELENIGIDIKVSTDNLQSIRDFDSLTESIEDTKGASLSLSGNAEEIYNKLLALQNLISNDDSFDKLYDKVGNTADSYKELTEQYKDFYDQYILQEKIFADDSQYADVFNNITDAAEKYNEAFTSGDENKIKKASDEYAEIVATAMDDAIVNGDSDVATYFENMYPALQSVVDRWKFNLAFDADTDGLQDKVQSVLDKCKDEKGRDLTVEEILGLGEANQQYQDLISIANSYNMSIEEMIELLKERNLVSAMDYQGLVGLFGQENVGKLLPEDLKIAYTIENVGNMTFEQLQAEIEKTREVADETPISLSISQTVDQLNTQIKPAFDSLKSAWQDIFTDDGEFALNSIDILSTCDSIKSKLDEMSELGLTVDYSAFEDFVRVLNNSESEAWEVEDAFDSLATSITNAGLSGTEDFETMKSALEDLGVVNSNIIAFQALVTNTDALQETIQNAGLTMDEFVISTNDGKIVASEAAQAFVEEMVGAENCQQALALLQLQQVLVNENSLNTTDDINACLTLATSAGVAVEALQQLLKATALYDSAVASGDTVAQSAAKTAMAAIKVKINSEIANFRPAEIDFSPIGNGAKSAGKSAGKSYKEGLEEELNDLNSVISGVTGRIDDQISSVNEQKSAVLEAIDAEKDALEEAKDAAISALEEERQKRLDVIEAQRKQIEQNIKNKEKIISQIETEIKAIKDANSQRQREIELSKTKFQLERMQNQRTKLVNYMPDTIVI